MKKISKALQAFVEESSKEDSYWIEATKLQFAMALENRRKAAKMTCKAIAESLGFSPAYISKVFRGESNMTIESMVKLARATGGQLVVQIAAAEAEVEAQLEQFSFIEHSSQEWRKNSTHSAASSVRLVAAVNDEKFEALAA